MAVGFPVPTPGIDPSLSEGDGANSGASVTAVEYIGTQTDPITDPDEARTSGDGPKVWIMAAGVVPANAIEGDFIGQQGGVAAPVHWALTAYGLINNVPTGTGVWTLVYDSGRHHMSNSGGVNGDTFTVYPFLAAGTYTLKAVTRKYSGGAIADIDFNGVEVGSVDTYAASTTQETVATITGIVVPTDGAYPLRVRVDGRNASSSNWLVGINALSMMRTDP